MKKTVTILSMAAILATSAMAVEGKGYVGLGIGGSGLSDSDLVKDASNGTAKLDTSDVGFLAYGGYQFNKIVGVEGAYNNYGSFSVGDNDEIKVSSASVSANLGYDFLDGQLRPFGLIGLSYLMSDYPDEGKNIDTSSLGFHMGLGLDYVPTMLKGVGFRVAYVADIYNATTDIADKNGKLTETDYSQSSGLLYLGVDYNF